jgi:hypothetical protein
MKLRKLLHQLVKRDVQLALAGDRLRVDAPTGAVDSQLQEVLVSHKQEILRLLPNTPELVYWPARCLESRYGFDQRHALLFPLIGKKVRTPEGTGMLVQVFAERARVALKGGEISADFQPELVTPVSGESNEQGKESRGAGAAEPTESTDRIST